jgi:hypothetical protein
MYFLNGSTPLVAARGVVDCLRVLHVLVLLCCLQGCETFTLNVAYQPTGTAQTTVGSDNTPVTLFLPPVEDQRSQGIRSLNVCFVGGAHTYQTDRPPTDIVREALATELSLLGVRVSSTATDAQASFKGVLRRFEQCLSEESSTIEIQAELHAQEGSRLLWGGTLQNQVVKKSGSAYSPTFAAILSAGLSQALSAAVQQLGQNSSFAQAVANLRGRVPMRPSPDLAFPPPPIY